MEKEFSRSILKLIPCLWTFNLIFDQNFRSACWMWSKNKSSFDKMLSIQNYRFRLMLNERENLGPKLVQR